MPATFGVGICASCNTLIMTGMMVVAIAAPLEKPRCATIMNSHNTARIANWDICSTPSSLTTNVASQPAAPVLSSAVPRPTPTPS